MCEKPNKKSWMNAYLTEDGKFKCDQKVIDNFAKVAPTMHSELLDEMCLRLNRANAPEKKSDAEKPVSPAKEEDKISSPQKVLDKIWSGKSEPDMDGLDDMMREVSSTVGTPKEVAEMRKDALKNGEKFCEDERGKVKDFINKLNEGECKFIENEENKITPYENRNNFTNIDLKHGVPWCGGYSMYEEKDCCNSKGVIEECLADAGDWGNTDVGKKIFNKVVELYSQRAVEFVAEKNGIVDESALLDNLEQAIVKDEENDKKKSQSFITIDDKCISLFEAIDVVLSSIITTRRKLAVVALRSAVNEGMLVNRRNLVMNRKGFSRMARIFSDCFAAQMCEMFFGTPLNNNSSVNFTN